MVTLFLFERRKLLETRFQQVVRLNVLILTGTEKSRTWHMLLIYTILRALTSTSLKGE